jgi:hypothetical protein
MRIIGGHDYYDGAMGYGHDPSILYVRGGAEIAIDHAATKFGLCIPRVRLELRGVKGSKWKNRYVNTASTLDVEHEITRVAVVICGTLYRGVCISTTPRSYYTTRSDISYFWSLDSVGAWLKENQLILYSAPVNWTEKHPMPLEEYFTPLRLRDGIRNDLIERRYSTLVWDEHTKAWGKVWRVDQPILKDIQFYKAVPPNILFQELELWIGGVLPAQVNPVVEISDEIRAAKHGMDKTSFRRPKRS